MALYVTREGPVATVNTWTNLSTLGAQTAAAIIVPSGYLSIKELWVSAMIDGAATDTTGCTFAVRLGGAGVKNGPVDIPVGSWGNEQTGNSSVSIGKMAQVIPVDVALNPGSEVWIKGAHFSAADAGSPEIAVTVCMTTQAASLKRYLFRTVSDAAVVDTKYFVTAEGDVAGVNQITVPQDCKRITCVYGACGGLTLATASGGVNFLRLEGNGLKEGDVVLPINGISNLSTTTGVSDAAAQATIIPTNLDVLPGGVIRVYVEHTGVAWSTSCENAIGLEFSG
jgi:hypothetical protein